MEGYKLRKLSTRSTRTARMMRENLKRQSNQQRTHNDQEFLLQVKMDAVLHQTSRVVSLRQKEDLGDTITLQVWASNDRPRLLQAITAGKQPDSVHPSSSPWKRLGEPTMFAELKGVNTTADGKPVGPILYLRSDDTLWLQLSGNYALWSLDSWHKRSGSLRPAGEINGKLDILYGRLATYADQLEVRRNTN